MLDTRVVIVIACLIYAQIIHALEEHVHNVKIELLIK